MTVARVTEISATSTKSFDDAVTSGIARASETVRNMKGAWVKDNNVVIEDGKVKEFKVSMEVTFIIDD